MGMHTPRAPRGYLPTSSLRGVASLGDTYHTPVLWPSYTINRFHFRPMSIFVRASKSDAHSNWFLKERRPAATGVEATWSALRREPRELASLWPAVAPGSAVLADF